MIVILKPGDDDLVDAFPEDSFDQCSGLVIMEEVDWRVEHAGYHFHSLNENGNTSFLVTLHNLNLIGRIFSDFNKALKEKSS